MSNVGYLVVLAFYTLLIVGGIHYYESRLKDLKASLEDYKRALSIARGSNNAEHYTFLQMENKRLKEKILKLEPIQYEHRNDNPEK